MKNKTIFFNKCTWSSLEHLDACLAKSIQCTFPLVSGTTNCFCMQCTVIIKYLSYKNGLYFTVTTTVYPWNIHIERDCYLQ